MKRKPLWKRSTVALSLPAVGPEPGSSLELAQFSLNMNKGFAGLPAEYETCLAGKHGEIWEEGQHTYKALFTSTIQARKFASDLGITTTCVEGDEVLFTFPKSMLYAAVDRLKIPSSPGTRVKLANSFGKRKKG